MIKKLSKPKRCNNCDNCVVKTSSAGRTVFWNGEFVCTVLKIIVDKNMQEKFLCNQYRKAKK